MTDRGMSAAMLAEIAKQQFTIAHLAELYLTNDSPVHTVYMTDSGFSIVWNGQTYIDTEGWIGVDGPDESFDLKINTLSFTLSGTVLANYSVALNYNFTDCRFVIRRALLQIGSSPLVISSPVVIWDGRIDSWTSSETPDTGQSTITWNTSNHWVDFTRISGRRSNDADQQLFYSGDLGFQYADQSTANIKWPS